MPTLVATAAASSAGVSGGGAGGASSLPPSSTLRQSASPALDATLLVWRHQAQLASELGSDCGLPCCCKAKLVLIVHAPHPLVYVWFAHDTLIAYARALPGDKDSDTRRLAERLVSSDGVGRRIMDGAHVVSSFITKQAGPSAPWINSLERKRQQPTVRESEGEIPTWTGFAAEAAAIAAAVPSAWTGRSTIADARAVLAALEALPPPTPQHLVTRAQIEALGGSWPAAQRWLHGTAPGQHVRRGRQAAGMEV